MALRVMSLLSLETVWAYGDLALERMAVPYLLAVQQLSPEVVRMSKTYVRHMAAESAVNEAGRG